jgi:uncharacterized membrane protein
VLVDLVPSDAAWSRQVGVIRSPGTPDSARSDIGIDDDFIRKVRDEVTPGTSALFVMSANVVADRVLGEFKGTGAHLASSNLSTEQETKLREVFAEDEAQTPAG